MYYYKVIKKSNISEAIAGNRTVKVCGCLNTSSTTQPHGCICHPESLRSETIKGWMGTCQRRNSYTCVRTPDLFQRKMIMPVWNRTNVIDSTRLGMNSV